MGILPKDGRLSIRREYDVMLLQFSIRFVDCMKITLSACIFLSLIIVVEMLSRARLLAPSVHRASNFDVHRSPLSHISLRSYHFSVPIERRVEDTRDGKKIIDVKVVDKTDGGNVNDRSTQVDEPKSPLEMLKDTTKSVVSKVKGLIWPEKKADPVTEAMNQTIDELDKVLGSRNPFKNPLGALARGVLKPMMKQMGKMMKEAAETNAAAVELTQREALLMILHDPQLKKLKLPGISDNFQNNEDDNAIYFDKNGNQIFVERGTARSDDVDESAWRSMPPTSIGSSHMNFNGAVSQQLSMEYPLISQQNSQTLIVQVVSVINGAGTRNQKAAVQQLSVFIPSSNRTVRIR